MHFILFHHIMQQPSFLLLQKFIAAHQHRLLDLREDASVCGRIRGRPLLYSHPVLVFHSHLLSRLALYSIAVLLAPRPIQEKTTIPIHFLHDKHWTLCIFCMTN